MLRLTSRLLPLLALAAFPTPAAAQTPLRTVQVAGGLTRPVEIVAPPDDDRMFIVERPGRIKILSGGSVLSTPFLDISSQVQTNNFLFTEQGLLSMAFHPDYATNGLFVVYYTDNSGDMQLSRFQVSAGDPNVADPASECPLLNISQPFSNHNGGRAVFGPDGMLYLSTGDGGSANDPNCRAQKVGVDKGKMLRIDMNTTSCGFTIPPDNPFIGVAGASDLVWHLGLRNPFRWSFDRITGEMYIGDVGQDAREEISWAPAGVGGLNFGWRVMEGNLCNGQGSCPVSTPGCFDPAFEPAIHDYNHPGAGVCSVTGGFVYRGCAIPDLQGTYFFADVCSEQFWSFEWDGSSQSNFMQRTAELQPSSGSLDLPVSFGEDRYGELYIVDLGGQIYKIVPDGAVAGADCDLNQQIDSCEIASSYVSDFDGNAVPDVCDPFAEDRNQAAAGESVSFTLDAGAANGGLFYWVLGSVTGTSPGIDFPGGINLPLNFDAYTNLTLSKPGLGVFGSFLSTLDGNGQGNASFNVPPTLDSSLVGLTLYHAYAASAVLGTVDYTSNAVPFTLI